MKKMFKVLIGFITLVVIVLVAVQWLLQSRLTPLIRQALPGISREAGLDIDIERASVNLFAGAASVSRLTARLPDNPDNPPALSIDRAKASIGWVSLLRKIVYIRNLTLKNARFTIVRQADGRILLPGGSLQPTKEPPIIETPETPPAPSEIEPSAGTSEPLSSSLPKIALKKADFSAAFIYEDRTRDVNNPSRVALNLTLIAEDLFTYGDLPPEAWGLLKLKSTSPSHPGAFAADIEARLAPLTSLATASLTAEGRILNVNLRELGDLAETLGVTSESADISLELDVREGIFASGSTITATIRNAELTGSLREKNKRVSLPATVTLVIPIRGSLEAPEVNIRQAITQSLLRNIADNPEVMLEQITIDGKSLRERLNMKNRD